MGEKHTATPLRQIKAKLDAMKAAGTVCCTEFRSGKHFVALIPTWLGGHMYYRQVAWTPFHERVGLGVMSNTYFSAELGLVRIFASARSALAKAGAA